MYSSMCVGTLVSKDCVLVSNTCEVVCITYVEYWNLFYILSLSPSLSLSFPPLSPPSVTLFPSLFHQQAVATATKGEVTSPGHTYEYRPPSYPSYDTDSLQSETPPSSASSSPSSTHLFGAAQSDPEASFNYVAYDTHRHTLLQNQPSVQDSSDHSPFFRTMSDTEKSLTQSVSRQRGNPSICPTGKEGEDSINVADSLNQSLHHMSPQPTSSLNGRPLNSQALDDRSTASKLPPCSPTSLTGQTVRPSVDSAIGSTCSSENDLSSMESVTLPHPSEDMESVSTNSTLQPTTSSYSTGLGSDVLTPAVNHDLPHPFPGAMPGPCVPQQVSPEVWV